MHQNTVSLFGTVHLSTPDHALTVTLPPRIRQLLTYLLLQEVAYHDRNSLIAIFWPDLTPAAAENQLRKTIFKLQQSFATLGVTTPPITSDRRNVQIDHRLFAVDLLRLEDVLRRVEQHAHPRVTRCPACLALLEAALDELPETALQPDTHRVPEPFSTWYQHRTASLRLQLQSAYRALIDVALRRQQVEAADRLATRWAAQSPDDEDALRHQLKTAAVCGRPQQALLLFNHARRRWRAEINGDVEPQTLRLVAQIHRGEQLLPALPPISPPDHPLFGRESALATLEAWLVSGTQRLISLIGIGGVGKTALARLAANRFAHLFSDGVLFVSLEQATSPADLLQSLARTLDLRPAPQQPLLDQIAALLSARDQLIILDNLEQIDGVAGLLHALIEQTERPQLLITSRRRLELRREAVLLLEALPLPAADDDWQHDPAAQLFLQRLGISATALSSDQRRDVVRIITRCGGLPLAIELAARLAADRPLHTVADQLDRQLAALQHDDPGRSLEATLRSTWQQLQPSAQQVLAVCGVFHGPFTPALLQACAAPVADPATVDATLEYAVNYSLLRLDADGRFTIHPLIRSLLRDELQLQPQLLTAVLTAHAHAYLQLIVREGPVHLNVGALTWCRRHAVLSEDLLAAWQVAFTQRLDHLLITAGFHLTTYLGILQLGLRFDTLLQQQVSTLDRTTAPALVQRLRGMQIRLETYHDDHQRVQPAVADLLASLGDAPPTAEQTIALRAQAGQLIDQRQFDEALRLIERSNTYQPLPDLPFVSANADFTLALLYNRRNQPAQAQPLLVRALAEARYSQNQRSELSILNELALLPTMAGQFSAAVQPLSEAVELARELGDLPALSTLLVNLGNARFEAGQGGEQALREIDEGTAIARQLGRQRSLRFGVACLAHWSHASRRFQTAYHGLRETLLMDAAYGFRPWTGEILLRYIDTLRRLGRSTHLQALALALAAIPADDDAHAARRAQLFTEILGDPPPPQPPLTPDNLRQLILAADDLPQDPPMSAANDLGETPA